MKKKIKKLVLAKETVTSLGSVSGATDDLCSWGLLTCGPPENPCMGMVVSERIC